MHLYDDERCVENNSKTNNSNQVMGNKLFE